MDLSDATMSKYVRRQKIATPYLKLHQVPAVNDAKVCNIYKAILYLKLSLQNVCTKTQHTKVEMNGETPMILV